jgi:hypothetical protein
MMTDIQNDMNAQDLLQIYEGHADRQIKHSELKNIRHQEFLARLKDSSDRFQEDLGNEIDDRLQKAAYHGHRTVRFQSVFDFNRPFGNVKISTLVNGWMTSDGGWDVERFKEIGLESTPFETLVKKFDDEKKIQIKNVSDRKRGFGFWIEASF